MKHKEKMRKKAESEWRSIKNKKAVLTVYLILRALVILTMAAQILNGQYENVYICILTLILFTLPSIVERRLHIDLPDTLEIVILVFIFSAEIMGEIQEYYLLIPFWDTVLHTINGFMFAAIGFCLVNLLNENKRTSMSLSPFYVAVTAFCFSMTIGVLWEFFEWFMDCVFHTDMQKDTVLAAIHTVNLDPGGHNVAYHATGIVDTILVYADGTQQSMALGGYLDIGLMDTMKDLLVNFIGAVVFSVIGFFYVKSKGKGKIARMFIPEVLEKPVKEEKDSE